MLRVEGSSTINRSPEDVWKFMTNLSNTPQWDPGVLEVRQTSSGPPGVGMTIQSTHPKRVLNARVVEYEPNRKFSIEFTSGPLKGSRATYSMEVVEGRTRLTRTVEVRLAGLYRLVAPFVARGANRERTVEVDNVKRILESNAGPRQA